MFSSDGFEEMCKIIEEIIPCHLSIEYVFWFITWALMEERFPLWSGLDDGGYTWEELQNLVQ